MIEYHPYAPDVQHNPYPCWKRLRDEAPVYFNPELNFYALSRYDDVLAAFLDPATFISGKGVTVDGVTVGGLDDAGRDTQPLIGLDPPAHTRVRKLLSRVFTPRRVNELEPFIRSVAAGYLDPMRDRDRFDVVQDFSLRFPLDVIGEFLAIPVELRETVHKLSSRIATRDPDPSVATDNMIAAIGELQSLYQDLVVERRKDPGDDVISMLIKSEVTDDDGRPYKLSDETIVSQFIQLGSAGHETVMKLIGNGVVALAWYPEQRAEMVRDPGLIPGAVEEMLRWDNSAPMEGRWCIKDVELHGTTIPAESRVMLLMGAANHDERQYREPELFDIHRKIERPMTFGFGIHLCLGAALSRLETRIAFEELLVRFPEYEIDDAGVVRGPASFFRGLDELPVVLP